MNGTNAQTGKLLGGLAHLRQSVRDILTTPIGSRVMRRDYGSRLFELVDAPMNQGTILAIIAATNEAISNWEPRFQVLKVQLGAATPGTLTLDITGNYLPDGQIVTLDGVQVK